MDKFRCEFSTITIPLSTITPIAKAIPVRDMILEDITKGIQKDKAGSNSDRDLNDDT
jgi:hypothetical protein